MRGANGGDGNSNHLSMRVDEATVEYLESLGHEWGMTREDGSVNRSEVLRTIIKTHNGILFGNFFGVTDNDALADEWGELGHLLASANEADRGVPAGLQEARLADVLEPVPLLVSAAEAELKEVP